MKTSTGEKIIRVQDGGFAAPDDGWIMPVINPFLHACCDCGLAHQVEYTLADMAGNEIPFPDGAGLLFRFSRDGVETANVRLSKTHSEQAREAVIFLEQNVPADAVAVTQFAGVDISDLDRDSLLRLVALLAAGKKEESRIILLNS